MQPRAIAHDATFWKNIAVSGPHDEPRVRVAVVIPCHDYGAYLAEALDSIFAQSAVPVEIVVVDDASSDNTRIVAERYARRGVAYLRGEWKSVAAARNAGAHVTNAPFLVFLDADDRLPPEYVRTCLAEMQDPSVAIAYGDMQQFGGGSTRVRMPQFDRDSLLQSNYISSHALVRRIAYDLVGGFRELQNAHQDWDLWRRIVQYPPWRAAKADTFVYYRIHADSMLQRFGNSAEDTYAFRAALHAHPVTIFTTFAGRHTALDPYLDALRALKFDPALIHLHWFNTSLDPTFDAKLREAALTLPFGSITIERAPLPASWKHTPDSLIAERVSGGNDARYFYQMVLVFAYNALLRSCHTEYAFVWEDDIVPAPDTLERLFAAMREDVVATVAPYRDRFRDCWLIWDATRTVPRHRVRRGTGVEEVGGSGFGCSLFRMGALRLEPITFTGDAPGCWYDHVAFARLGRQGKILCDWDIDVQHLQADKPQTGSAGTGA